MQEIKVGNAAQKAWKTRKVGTRHQETSWFNEEKVKLMKDTCKQQEKVTKYEKN